MASSPSGLTELCSGKSGSRSRSPVASASAPGKSARGESALGESAFMTGTLAVTASRGEAGPRWARAEAGPWPGWGRASKAYIPARRADRYPGFLFHRIYPRKKYADRRYKRFPGYYGGYYDEDGRDHTTLPGFGKPGGAARNAPDRQGCRHGRGRLRRRTFGTIAATILARANRAAEAEQWSGRRRLGRRPRRRAGSAVWPNPAGGGPGQTEDRR